MIVERSMHPEWLSNAYLVADRSGGNAVFVDSGGPIEPLISAVDRLEVQVTHLLTTHAHSDHVANHEELERRFGVAILADPRENVAGAEPLAHGDVIELGELRIECLRTPGHSPGMLSFVADGEACFTGDTLFAGSVGGTMDGFDDLRRSTGLQRLGAMVSLDVLTEEDLAGFQPEVRDAARELRQVFAPQGRRPPATRRRDPG